MISYTVILNVKLSLVFKDSTLFSLLVMWHKTLSVFVTHEHVNSNWMNWFASLKSSWEGQNHAIFMCSLNQTISINELSMSSENSQQNQNTLHVNIQHSLDK